MSDPFGFSADQRELDVEFTVPMVHRLRFTEDCTGHDFDVLRELLQPGTSDAARVQIWVDRGIVDWDSSLVPRLERHFADAADLQLVSGVELLSGGEEIKNDRTAIDRMLAAINRDNLDRRSYILVIGGGAVLDAVGYAAAIAHRGIRLIRIPTTTLAQADSGVGVKNAVNWFDKKNWKGTFATPWAVVNDERLLAGLSDRDFRCGFSEALKVALLKDREFFDLLHRSCRKIAVRDMSIAGPALRRSVLLHLWHITRGGDPFESQQARPLDFGHWSAHKLESILDYQIRHGEAVAIGVAVDVAYSHLKHGLDGETLNRTFEILAGLQLPTWNRALNADVIFDGLEEFRQHLGGDLTVTLVRGLGEPIDVHEIDRSAMRDAMSLVASRAECGALPTAPAADTDAHHAQPQATR